MGSHSQIIIKMTSNSGNTVIYEIVKLHDYTLKKTEILNMAFKHNKKEITMNTFINKKTRTFTEIEDFLDSLQSAVKCAFKNNTLLW